MFLNKELISKSFKNHILPNLAVYIKKNIYTVQNNAFRGELFTLIRRHLNFLTNPSRFNITLNDIEHIGVTHDGIITSIGFSYEYHNSNSRKSSKTQAIDLLNNILQEIDYSFNDYQLEKELDNIIHNINITTIVKPLNNEHQQTN